MMTQLSVNINKVALIRNSRGQNRPDLLKFAKDCIRFGADGITVHPRPDERHIRKQDVYDLKEAIDVELNVEGYPSESFLKMIEEVSPAQCTLVPDPPEALTSSAGWDTIQHQSFLTEVCSRLKEAGVRSSIFVETKLNELDAAALIQTDRIEFYTEPYAAQFNKHPHKAVEAFVVAATHAHKLELEINAGHDLNLENLTLFAKSVPNLLEVSIGHALVIDALYMGIEKTIKAYQQCLGK